MRICALKTSDVPSCCVETFCIANDSDSDVCMPDKTFHPEGD